MLSFLLLWALSPPIQTTTYTVTNGLVSVQFATDPTRGLVLVSASDPLAPTPDFTFASDDLWAVSFFDPATVTTTSDITPSKCTFPPPSITNPAGSLTARWSCTVAAGPLVGAQFQVLLA